MTDNNDQIENHEETVKEQVDVQSSDAPEKDAQTDAPSSTPVNVTAESTLVDVQTTSAEEASYNKPHGAFLFVILMMTFYVVYWILAYIEIFVARGR